MLTVVGLDPSFSGLGIVAVPSDWACSLERVRRKLLASKPGRPLVDRICDLACDVCTWIDWARGKGSVEVFIEGGITGRGMGDTVRMQIELGAVIKHELRRELGIEVRVVEQNSARKLFLGKIPMSDRKDAVVAEFDRRWPAAGWTHDAVDALVTANAAMATLGLEHVSTVAPPKPPKRRAASAQVPLPDTHRRIPSSAGFCSPKALPKGPNGRNLCRQCSAEVDSAKKTFCGKDCVEAWKLRTQPAFQRRKVNERDKGICAECRVDTNTLPLEGGRLHRWEMDHIVPVVEGGGSCDLSNLRTLCISCHRKATAELRRRLRAKGAAA